MQKQQGVAEDHSRNAITQIQHDIRELTTELRGFGDIRHSSKEHDNSLRRVWADIERRAIEQKLADEKRDLEIKAAADTGKRITWMAVGAATIMGVLITVLTFVYNSDKATVVARTSLLDQRIYDLDQRLDRVDVNQAKTNGAPTTKEMAP